MEHHGRARFNSLAEKEGVRKELWIFCFCCRWSQERVGRQMVVMGVVMVVVSERSWGPKAVQ